MRSEPYWIVERLPGEDEAAHALRAGRVYFSAQQEENIEWWRRIGSPIDLVGKSVLDIGCGHGALSLDAAARGAIEVLGIDLDASRVAFAVQHRQECCPELGERVRFLALPVAALAASAGFDVVLSKDTFEHVADLGQMLHDIAARTKPGGLLVAGFSPLYYSPNGDHGRYGLPLPWLHAVLPQKWVLRWASHRLGRPIRTSQDVGLNRLALPEFRRLLHRAGWVTVSLRVNPIENRLRPLIELCRRIPGLARLFTIGVYGVFVRQPVPSADHRPRTFETGCSLSNSAAAGARARPSRAARAIWDR